MTLAADSEAQHGFYLKLRLHHVKSHSTNMATTGRRMTTIVISTRKKLMCVKNLFLPTEVKV